MTQTRFKFVREALADVWPLYGAAFSMAFGLTVLWTVMPFIIRNIGGTKEHVGYSWAANMFGYLVCLLFAGTKLGHLSPLRTTRAAAGAVLLAILLMLAVVHNAIAGDRPGSPALIWIVIIAGTVAGGAMSLFWPYLMAWVSADYEGAVLNRRLGTYNSMWSSAAIIGPMIGGVLVQWHTVGPIAIRAASLVACLFLLFLAHEKSAGTAASMGSAESSQGCLDRRLLQSLRWMARISLFCSWLCLSVSRSQFAILFTEMGFTESQFGVLVTTFGICNCLMLTGSGRHGFWHFKPGFNLAAQSMLAASILLLIFGRKLSAFGPSFVIMGCAFGFSYSSHLYYGACGSRNRSKQMTIHEVTISLGVIVGSGSGGYLAENYGSYWPYWFALIFVALGLIAQAAIWIILRKN